MNGIQRVCRNVKYLFDATIIDPVQIKVREATSSEPWGPAASSMAELAQLTYTKSPVIIPDLFLRLSEDSWRVVYKALVVIDYLIKYGSESVLVGCTRNLAYLVELQNCRCSPEEGQDYGLNIREKSRQIVALLTDPTRLKIERLKAQRIRERITYQQSPYRDLFRGATPAMPTPEREARERQLAADVDRLVPPADEAQEALQLRLALAASQQDSDNARKSYSSARKAPPIKRRLIIPDPEPDDQLSSGDKANDCDLIDLSEFDWAKDDYRQCDEKLGFSLVRLGDDPSRSVIQNLTKNTATINTDLLSTDFGNVINAVQSLNLSPTNPFAEDIEKAQSGDLDILNKWLRSCPVILTRHEPLPDRSNVKLH